LQSCLARADTSIIFFLFFSLCLNTFEWVTALVKEGRVYEFCKGNGLEPERTKKSTYLKEEISALGVRAPSRDRTSDLLITSHYHTLHGYFDLV
jgi:hypothetical protein